MSSSSPDSRKFVAPDAAADDSSDSLAEPAPADDDEKAVENFVLEVGAGRTPSAEGVAGPTRAMDARPTPAARSNSTREDRQIAAPDRGESTSESATPIVKPAENRLLAQGDSLRNAQRSIQKRGRGRSTRPALKVNDRPAKATKATRQRRKIPSWVISTLVHAAVLVALSFLTLANLPQDDDFGLVAGAPHADEPLEEFTDVELDADELEEFTEEFTSDLLDAGAASLGDLSADAALSNIAREVGAPTHALGELGALFGDEGAGMAEWGDGLAAPPDVTFFGAKIEGNRIVFLVDNSGGMQTGALEALIEELLKSVAVLTPKQRFYVIFYSDTIYPLFYPEPANDFIHSTEQSRESLKQWLDTVEICYGNAIDEGLAATTAINPDVVYFLTDGQVNTTRDGRKLRMFLESQGRRFKIHTFGMGAGKNGRAADDLQQIAAANDGEFRAIKIEAKHRALAQENARPYHREPSGGAWGRASKAFR